MAFLSSYWVLDAIIVFSSVFVAAYFYMTRHFGHWKNRGVMEVPPTPFVGNFGSCLSFRLAVFEYLRLLYEKNKSLPYIGFYIFDKPALVLRDPEIIKNVLVKDFNCFSNRYVGSSESDVLGYYNLFFIKNPAWKKLRNKLTSAFSSAKMRAMYPLLDAVGDELVAHLDGLDSEDAGQVMELKEICAAYATDCIATCAFGLEVNSLKNPNAAFREVAKKSFEFTYIRGFETMSQFFMPNFAKLLRFEFYEASSSKFLQQALLDTLNKRSKSGVKRNDLIDLLIELRNNQGQTEDSDSIKFDDKMLVAQAAIFFAAGFETTSTVISFTLHELSLHPKTQMKLRHEITTALEENGGKLSYDVLLKLPYMDKVISEALRKYPSLSFLDRVAQSNYTVPKTGLVIEEGTPVYVSLLGLHYDPEYYPNPDQFDPERFNEENKRQRLPFVYLPFGDGPRNCIGLRFGLMQVKIALLKILTSYELAPCEQTARFIRFDAKAFVLRSVGGLYHRVRKLRQSAACSKS